MQNVTLSFPDLNHMAYFIMRFRVSNFTPDWQRASLKGEMERHTITCACDEYGATIVEINAANAEASFAN
jgi:hypothetical protein